MKKMVLPSPRVSLLNVIVIMISNTFGFGDRERYCGREERFGAK
jgi:hypothetical protein